jgi:hypothetical protein
MAKKHGAAKKAAAEGKLFADMLRARREARASAQPKAPPAPVT